MHRPVARTFVDDDGPIAGSGNADGDLLIINVVNEKTTRQGRLFQVWTFKATMYVSLLFMFLGTETQDCAKIKTIK